jgi:gamma-glutamylcyclotransferase (GGCT)/AIG2-like uncharacterized protein YtfP
MENECVNERAKAEYMGEGKTDKNFNLYQYGNGYFPCVSLEHTDNATPVVVDVFQVTQDGLEGPYDALEGYPGFYNRTKILVKMYNDDLVEAWIYHIDEAQPNVVESGDWVEFKTKPAGGILDDDKFFQFTD